MRDGSALPAANVLRLQQRSLSVGGPVDFHNASRLRKVVTETTAPVVERNRISNLDAIRGVAVLGILPMNVLSFALVGSAYANISAPGTETVLDWAIAISAEVFVDQKFMALFSMLFGAGIVLFYERAQEKSEHPAWLSLWRNFLLLVIGLLHGFIWEGDILALYAILAPILIVLRRLPSSMLLTLGIGVYALSPCVLWLSQSLVSDPIDVAGLWVDVEPRSELADLVLITDSFVRALGAMLIGIALYRTGVFQGDRSADFYRRLTIWGLGIGLPLAVMSVVWVAVADFSIDVAFLSAIPNTIGTIPIALAYLAIIIRWNSRTNSRARLTIRSVGRMALTNYLAQSLLGVVTFSVILSGLSVSRSGAALFVIAVWSLQLWWSPLWLRRFRYGPVEWLWRCLTYRRWQPMRYEVDPSPR